MPTARETAAAFKERYDADTSPARLSKVTAAALERAVEWHKRPLAAIYPMVYFDCIVLKVRQDTHLPGVSCSPGAYHNAFISQTTFNG